MNTAIEILNYYKKKFGSRYIFLFHVENHYIALLKDAVTVSKITGVSVNKEVVSVPESNVLDYVERLYEAGYTSKVIEYRDDNRRFSLPDISCLQEEELLCEKYSI